MLAGSLPRRFDWLTDDVLWDLRCSFKPLSFTSLVASRTIALDL
jgi:hypothetical protein